MNSSHVLADNPIGGDPFEVAGRRFRPAHFHVTEVGRVRKDFIDCGGIGSFPQRRGIASLGGW